MIMASLKSIKYCKYLLSKRCIYKEILVDTNINECVKRDTRNLYMSTNKNIIGLDIKFEKGNPDLILTNKNINENIEKICQNYLYKHI